MGLFNTCAKCQHLSLKNGVDIGTFVGNNRVRHLGLGMGLYNTCAKRQDLSLKNGVDIGTFVRNN